MPLINLGYRLLEDATNLIDMSFGIIEGLVKGSHNAILFPTYAREQIQKEYEVDSLNELEQGACTTVKIMERASKVHKVATDFGEVVGRYSMLGAGIYDLSDGRVENFGLIGLTWGLSALYETGKLVTEKYYFRNTKE